MIDWGHVLGTHLPHFMFFGILVLGAQIVYQAATDVGIQPVDPSTVWRQRDTIGLAVQALFTKWTSGCAELIQSLDLFSPAVKTTFAVLVVLAWYMSRQNPVYLLSFATFQAPDSWKCSHADICEIMRRQKCFTPTSIEFMERILERSGTGQATAWPPGITQCLQSPDIVADRSMVASRKESETVIFDIVERALQKANVHPREIDVLVINCSLFSPTPSLCAMVLSHFGMRSDVATYNLSGMGCAAGLISIDLAKQLLGHTGGKAKKALVVSTEILTPNFYHGNDRGFLIQNTLFRCGGAAIVLSNSWLDGRRAWYKLLHTVRVQGTGEAAYECVYETEDADGERGVRLSKDIVKVAGKCMEKNFTMLGPQVLPLTEQALVVLTIVLRFLIKYLSRLLTNVMGMGKLAAKLPIVKPYVPDFKRGIDHFCIHAGGRAVIDGIEKNLRLEPYHTEASRMTLLNHGNTSSSSIWYELEYIQEQQKSNPLKKGDRVMQVAFGSGFKCTSGVWLKL
jgi:predicted naringenin-chalcone synthase